MIQCRAARCRSFRWSFYDRRQFLRRSTTRLARLAECDQSFIREAIDLVVFIGRLTDGRGTVTEIKEL
jgi:hypothetical protein